MKNFDDIAKLYDLSRLGICTQENRTGILGELKIPQSKYNSAQYVGEFISEFGQGEERFVNLGSTPQRHLKTYQLDNGGIVGCDGLVYDVRSGFAVAETVFCWWSSSNHHVAFRSPRKIKPRHLNGRALSLLTHGDTCFYHWMLEGLSRLGLVPDSECYDYYLVAGPERKWMKTWLKELKIPCNRIVFCDNSSHLTFDQIVFTDRPFGEQWPSHQVLEFLRESVRVVEDVLLSSTALLISRRDAGTRFGLWEEPVAAHAHVFSVQLETLSASDQVSLLRNSRIVIGAHGSGLSNIAFCSPGTVIIEVFSNSQALPLYSRISSVLGLRHICVREEDAETVFVNELLNVLHK
jgi:hypothetical protein